MCENELKSYWISFGVLFYGKEYIDAILFYLEKAVPILRNLVNNGFTLFTEDGKFSLEGIFDKNESERSDLENEIFDILTETERYYICTVYNDEALEYMMEHQKEPENA